MTAPEAGGEPYEAVRHPASGKKCCPLHGPTLGATMGQPVSVSLIGEPWVLYDSEGDGINTDRVHEPSTKVEGNAFAMTYVCGVGNHPVVVYIVTDRKPSPGRAFQVTRGSKAKWYHDKTPVTIPTVVDGVVRYPVAEALLRRIWGLQAVTDKRRAQRHARKDKKAVERVEAMRTRRRKNRAP